ncbi:MAG: histidine phosphatase family protein [Panacagrimonas sp.]
MSRLVLVRHAQASFGAERYDRLSELGCAQAQAVGRHFLAQGRHFDRVWIGPRDRHRLTARYALEPLGLDWQVPHEPALDEFAEGQQVLASTGPQATASQSESHRDAMRRYVARIDAWAEGREPIIGAPPVEVFRATVAEWLARATADSARGQSVLAVTSAGVVSAVVAIVLDLPNPKLATLMREIHNGSLTEFVFSPGRAAALRSFNVGTHLPDDLLTRI